MSDHQALSRIWRPLALVALIAIVLALTLYGALSGYSGARAQQANDEWARQFGTLEEVLERYPPRDTNGTALELETLAGALGIDVAPRALRTAAIDPADAEAWKAVYRRIVPLYVNEQIERGHGPVAAPPPELRDWLVNHRDALDAFTSVLVESDPPRWMLHVEDQTDPSIPNLLGHLQLQKLLAADALYRVHLGDNGLALARVEAAWILNSSLTDDPILITQLLALVGLTLQTTTLRHIEVADERYTERWQARLAAARPRERIIRAMEFEAWHWTQLPELTRNASVGKWHRAALNFAAPYARLCVTDATSRLRTELAHLKRLDYLCDRDLSRVDADLAIELPGWNKLGGLALPNLIDAVTRAAQAEVDLELTSRILELRAGHATTGRWPPAARPLAPSVACPGDRWDYDVDPERGPVVAFSREMLRPDRPGPAVPLRFELSER